MLIRSQDKKSFVNTDKVSFGINTYHDGKARFGADTGSQFVKLADYSTETKALKVSDQIFRSCCASNPAYQMPSNEEVEG